MRKLCHGDVALIALVVAYLVLGLSYGIANPIFESPDEPLHFRFTRDLVSRHALPVQSTAIGQTQSHQPPLFYVVGAAATFWISTDDSPQVQQRNPFGSYELVFIGSDNRNQFLHSEREDFPYRGTALAVHILRVVSTIFGAATVVLCYLIARRVFPANRALALGSVAFIAFNPQFLFINSSVNNDSLVAALCAAVLYVIVGWPLSEGHGPRRGLVLGALLGAGVLAKLTALLLAPLAAIALVMMALRDRSAKRAVQIGLVGLLTAFALTGWWFVRNVLLYGELTGMDASDRIWGYARSQPRAPSQVLDSLPYLWNTYWGTFGTANVPLDGWVYTALLLLICLAGTGLVWGLIRASRESAESNSDGARAPGRPGAEPCNVNAQPHAHSVAELAGTRRLSRQRLARFLGNQRAYQMTVLVLWLILLCGAQVTYIQTSEAKAFGRYLFPAAPSIGLLIFLGLAQLVTVRRTALLAGATAVGMFSLSLAALWFYLIPAYSKPPPLNAEQVANIPNPVAFNIADEVELLGYEIRSRTVQPGQSLWIDLYWRALRKMTNDYDVVLRLFGVGDFTPVAQRDTYPGGGTFPTSFWKPGETYRDSYRVRIPASVRGPAMAQLDVGLYDLVSKQRLPVVSSGHGVSPDSAPLGTVRIAAGPVAIPQRVEVSLEDSISLSGYEVGEAEAQSGDNRLVTVRLFWHADRKVAGDYTAFAQLLDVSGKLVAQHDSKPANGNYPTWAWESGEVVPESHPLQLPAEVAPGKYTVIVGMYDLTTMKRLRVLSADRPVANSAIALCDVTL